MVRGSDGAELGSLFNKMFLPAPKSSPAKAKGGPPKPLLSRANDGSGEDEMDVPKDDVDTAEKRRPRSPARPARPAVPSAPRRLNGLKTPAMAPQVSEARGPPLRLNVPESRKRKLVPEPPSYPPEVWERVIDSSRNAVYYWEHRTRRSSWDVPPRCFGWWERLRTEHTNLEFFWNSATHQTLWNLPLAPTPSAASVSLALGDEPVCRSLPLRALPDVKQEREDQFDPM